MNSENIDKLNTNIELLSARPGMFIGNDISLKNINLFLSGYFLAMLDRGELISISSWSQWVQLRYKKWEPKWTWWAILINEFGSEKKALEILPKIMQEFLSDVESGNEQYILDLYSKK